MDLAGKPYDVGAEAFLARRPEVPALLAELGLTGRLVHPTAAQATIRAAGSTVALPGGTVLGVPTSAARLAGLLSDAGLAAVTAEPMRPLAWTPGGDVALGRLLRARFGDELTDRLVDPLLGGVYAGRVDTLGLRPTMPALAAALDAGAASLTAAADAATNGESRVSTGRVGGLAAPGNGASRPIRRAELGHRAHPPTARHSVTVSRARDRKAGRDGPGPGARRCGTARRNRQHIVSKRATHPWGGRRARCSAPSAAATECCSTPSPTPPAPTSASPRPSAPSSPARRAGSWCWARRPHPKPSRSTRWCWPCPRPRSRACSGRSPRPRRLRRRESSSRRRSLWRWRSERRTCPRPSRPARWWPRASRSP